MFRSVSVKVDHESVDHELIREAWSTMLSVMQIRALKPAKTPYKVADADGLFLLVQPSGALLWRFRFKLHGIEKKISLGGFPDVTLQEARKLGVSNRTLTECQPLSTSPWDLSDSSTAKPDQVPTEAKAMENTH